MEPKKRTEICDRCGLTIDYSEAHAHLDVVAEVPGEGRYEDQVAFCNECNGAFVGLLTENNDLLYRHIAISAIKKHSSE
jgi:hypothetical protein